MKSSATINHLQWFTKTLMLLCVVLYTGCISPLDQEPDDFTDYLVVEGFIDDDFGPHDLTITRISKFADVFAGGVILPIDAEVTIIDQFGVRTPVERQVVIKKENFNVASPGCVPGTRFVEVKTVHQTPPSFKGEVGNTYTLEIRIDDKTYQSDPVTMLPTPPIESVEVRLKQLPSLDPSVIPSGIEVIANWNDPPEERNYYQWIVNGIYPISTPPIVGACCLYDAFDGGESECWIIENDIEGNEIAFSDTDVNGQLTSLSVGFIEDNGLRFSSVSLPANKRYYLEVEQYSISEEAFGFFERIKTLSEISGDIFDPVAQSIRGNIYNVENNEEPVVGYFGAFSVQKKGFFVHDSTFTFRQPSKEACGDCRTRKGAQTEIPEPFR